MLKLIGVVTKHPACIVTELLVCDLQTHLRRTPLSDEYVAKLWFMLCGSAFIAVYRQRLDIMISLASGLEYVHHQGIIHCDIAARNVLVSSKSVRSSVK